MIRSSRPTESAIPRVSRSTGPALANATNAYPTEFSTLKAKSPLRTGACWLFSDGRCIRSHSFVASCTQKPAAEIVNSRRGDKSDRCEMAKNGKGPKRTPSIVGFAENTASNTRCPPSWRPSPSAAPARNFTVSDARCSSDSADCIVSAIEPDCAKTAAGRIASQTAETETRALRQSTAFKLHFGPLERGFEWRRTDMLETIAIILIVLWLLGMVSGYTLGNFIYVLLVIAIVLFLVRLVSGRRVV